MEGQMRRVLCGRKGAGVLAVLSVGYVTGFVFAQAQGSARAAEGAEISLRKSINTRVYQGREIEGEERQIGRGDSLWRLLVEERGVSGKQFRNYIVVIRGLNPQVKNLDVLRIGDKIFIPLHPAQLLEGKAAEGASSERPPMQSGTTVDYRVKAGEHLYQILRDQLNLADQRQIAQHFALVKDLNPERKNWDTLIEGDVIRLPGSQGSQVSAGAPPALPRVTGAPRVPQKADPRAHAETPVAVPNEPPTASPSQRGVSDWRSVLRAPAKENLALIARVVDSVGSQMQESGEEVIDLKEGAVRFDKRNYPVVFNPSLKQRVVLDPDGKIPPSLRAKLADPMIGAPIVSMTNGLSIQDAVGQLLAGLGYQALPGERPVVIQEDGVAYEARGHWMALAPEESNRPQQIYVISLTENGVEIPEYLRAQLGGKGLHLRNIPLPATAVSERGNEPSRTSRTAPAKVWPRDKKDLVDSLLFAFGIPFGVAERLSVEVQNGLRIDARTDRLFELNGRRVALFFQKFDPEIQQALQQKERVRTVELEIGSLTSREVIARLLNLIGDRSSYREHRFAALGGSAQDRLTVTAWGFHVPNRSLFITDRRIPSSLNRFFSEKGLEIIYFH